MLQFDDRSNGSKIELNAGENFEIIQHENPTTGFRWNLISRGEPACRLLDNSFNSGSGAPGSGGNHSWQFLAVKEGLGKIEFAYQRPWEQVNPPAQSFTLSVYIRA
jgi:predicted secreted protein